MKILNLIQAVALITIIACQDPLTTEQIVAKSVAYHDPEGLWSNLQSIYLFDEYRADGTIRETTVSLDLPRNQFMINRAGNYQYLLNPDTFQIIAGEITPERAETIKNYYLYLWGLPMKLLDAGTPLESWVADTLKGKETYKVRVNYEKDTWFFHFDRQNFEMIGYSFYQDKELQKGERIELSQPRKMGNMIIPTVREWYTLPEQKYLGKDHLTAVKQIVIAD